jgi:hypothetical protein
VVVASDLEPLGSAISAGRNDRACAVGICGKFDVRLILDLKKRCVDLNRLAVVVASR